MEEQAAVAAPAETTEPIEEQAAGGAPDSPGVLGALTWRGIGLSEKLKAYNLQNEAVKTSEVNPPGLPLDNA